MSSTDGSRRPRQNPVFMFLPSGVKHGSRTVFSVPGSTADEGQRATILKENLVIPTWCPGSPKKRGRQPPPPFRLPTEEEERIFREKGVEGSSKDELMVTSPSLSGKLHNLSSRRKNLDVKPANIILIKKLFMLSVEVEDEMSDSTESPTRSTRQSDGLNETGGAEIEKCLRWVRLQGPELFWTTIHKNVAKQHEEWKCFEIIHAAATTTVLKFMSLIEKNLKFEEKRKELQMMNFLRRTLAGSLLVADKQREIPGNVLEEFLEKFYACGFRALMNVQSRKAALNSDAMDVDTDPADIEMCEGCLDQPCICLKLASLFEEANLALQALGLMDEFAGPRLYSVIKKDVASKISEIGTDEVDVCHIEDLSQWLKHRTTVWIDSIYPYLPAKDEHSVKTQLQKDLRLMMLEQYGQSVIKDLFTVIIEFPESQPLLDDLKQCMREVNLRNSVVSSLKSSLERRLLNAGVNTSEVLEAYIATVRALKYVDPSGILVQLVTPPVREYLKHREETVRVILISLTEESGELSEELARNPTNPDKNNKITMSNWRNWEPDPIDVPKDKHNLRKSDLIEALVSIYGSKTVFIDEYRALLADRLLRLPKPGSITREIKCLELLKLRFGESDLQKCEVMLKDVSDSQRLNTRFYEEDGAVLANEAVHVTGLIVSAQFWPSFKQEDLQLPASVQAALEKYTKAFEMIKGNRTLEWQKHIGTVELEIQLGKTDLTFTVTPIQATIIYHFQEKDKWTIDELAKVTGTTTAYLSSRIGFWISKGIIVHVGHGTYALADSINESSKATGVIPNKYVEEVDSDSPMASTSSQRATELQVFWSYIEAMLTNLESLPLARIHSMLKLFATVECSSEELQRFLDDKVSHNLLVYSAGQYQLPK